MADVMDVEEAGVLDCFVEAGAEYQRTQVAPEADTYTFAEIAVRAGVTIDSKSYAATDGEDVLEDLRMVTSTMDEDQVALEVCVLLGLPKFVTIVCHFVPPFVSLRILIRCL